MTLRANTKIAGFTFLLYIAAGMTGLILGGASGEGTAARLANIAQHASELRAALLLGVVANFCALVLAVTLYAITRDVDRDLSLIVLVCRTAEGVVGGMSLQREAGRLWLATAAGAGAPDAATTATLGAVLLKLPGWNMEIGGHFFAVGSLVFSYLLLRGRQVPVPLAWLGVIASILVVVVLPLQLAGIAHGLITRLIWLPMLAFEVPLGFWLIIKGVAAPAKRQSA